MTTPPKAPPKRPVAPDRYEGLRGIKSYPGMAAYEIEKAVPGSVEPELAGRGESIPKVGEPPPSQTRFAGEVRASEATAREPTDIPMPPEWKGTESQWAALSPQKKEQFVADTQEAHRASQMYVPPGKRK